MRTTWKMGLLTVHNFIPCPKVDVHVLSGVDPLKERVMYETGKLLGVFRISGLRELWAKETGKKNSIAQNFELFAVVERRFGCSINEFAEGVNLSGGCYTLYNDTTQFNPSIIRAVLRTLDCSLFEKRVRALKVFGSLSALPNAFPINMSDLSSSLVVCPRCMAEHSKGGVSMALKSFGKFYCAKCNLRMAEVNELPL